MFLHSLRRSPSRALLLVQFLALLLYPLADGNRIGQIAISAISVGVLGMAVWVVHRSPRTGWIAALLAALGIGLLWAHSVTGAHLRGSWAVRSTPRRISMTRTR